MVIPMDVEKHSRRNSACSNEDTGEIEEQNMEIHHELQAPCVVGEPSAPSYVEALGTGEFVSVPLDDFSCGPSSSDKYVEHAAPSVDCPTAPHINEVFETDKASVSVCPAAPYINEGFEPDGDIKTLEIPTAPEEEEEEEDPEEDRAREIATSFPPLNEEDVTAACQKYVDNHCCYCSRFVRQMKVADIAHGIVFDYMLNSFGEKRETTMQYAPYKGGFVDGPQNGTPPDAWSMRVQPTTYFKADERMVEVPHTSEIRNCHKCGGTGKVKCWICSGTGRRSCTSCSGRGKNSQNQRCFSCSGSGRQTCFSCNGTGKVTCSKCKGYCKLRWYKVLIVQWQPHQEHFVSDSEKLPREHVLKAIGKFVYVEEAKQLLPICNAPDASVNIASTQMINRHKSAFPHELILKQRQTLRAIPLTRVTYYWKNTSGEFYVYGTENRVYFEDYPQKCCCCVIL